MDQGKVWSGTNISVVARRAPTVIVELVVEDKDSRQCHPRN